jgi:hypothetical protein
MLLQMPLQQTPAAAHAVPSGRHVSQTSALPVSRHCSPGQQSGPYKKSRPEQGPPLVEHPQWFVAWLHTPSQHGVFGGAVGGGFGPFSWQVVPDGVQAYPASTPPVAAPPWSTPPLPTEPPDPLAPVAPPLAATVPPTPLDPPGPIAPPNDASVPPTPPDAPPALWVAVSPLPEQPASAMPIAVPKRILRARTSPTIQEEYRTR